MADSWKDIDLDNFLVNDDMIDYVLNKYGTNWQVNDAKADDILDDVLKRESEKNKQMKCDKRRETQLKIQELIQKRSQKREQQLDNTKHRLNVAKVIDKIFLERELIIIESDKSENGFSAQTPSDVWSDHNSYHSPYSESFDNNPFQVTPNESFDNNPFQVISNEHMDDTFKSSSEDTCSSDYTWDLKKNCKAKPGYRSKQAGKEKLYAQSATGYCNHGPVKLYDDSSSDKQLTVYKGTRGSSLRNASITNSVNIKSNCNTHVVSTNKPPPVKNCVLGLAAVQVSAGGTSAVLKNGKRKKV